MGFTPEQHHAIDECRHHIREHMKALDSGDKERIRGTKYALDMDAIACQILGIDPSRITPDGYDEGAK